MPADTALTEDVLMGLEAVATVARNIGREAWITPDTVLCLIAAARQLPAERAAREAVEKQVFLMARNEVVITELRSRIATLEAERDAAVRAERDACAEVCESLQTTDGGAPWCFADGATLAAAIRNRGTP